MIAAGLAGRTLRDKEFIGSIVDAITSLGGLSIEPLTAGDLIQAQALMGKYVLDYEDALHLATALRLGVGSIVPNDEDFDRTPLRRIF